LSSSSGDADGSGVSAGASRGRCRPWRNPPDSESDLLEGDWRGFTRGANFAEGDGRVEGGSSDSSLRRGEINECGVALDRGDIDGFGETVTLGATEAFGLGASEAFALGDGDGRVATDGAGDGVVFLGRLKLKAELFASAASMLATVRISPPLKVPSVLFAGNVAVGAWPTGIGS
jgi:hypothetical protein